MVNSAPSANKVKNKAADTPTQPERIRGRLVIKLPRLYNMIQDSSSKNFHRPNYSHSQSAFKPSESDSPEPLCRFARKAPTFWVVFLYNFLHPILYPKSIITRKIRLGLIFLAFLSTDKIFFASLFYLKFPRKDKISPLYFSFNDKKIIDSHNFYCNLQSFMLF